MTRRLDSNEVKKLYLSGWTADRWRFRALHDFVAGTVVVSVQE